MPDKPNPGFTTLYIKLASLIVHQEEAAEELVKTVHRLPPSYAYDKAAIETLRNDPEVIAFIEGLRKQGFLPVKRSERAAPTKRKVTFYKLDVSGDLEKGWYWEVGARNTGPFASSALARKDAKAEGFEV